MNQRFSEKGYNSFEDPYEEENFDLYDNDQTEQFDDFDEEIGDPDIDIDNEFDDEIESDELDESEDAGDIDVEDIERNTLCNNSNNKYSLKGEDVKEQFKKIMKDYHSGDIGKKDEALEAATKLLDGFVHLIIRRNYSTYANKYFTDLLQEGYLGIIIGMEKYDPERSMPTTFFYSYIKHEIQGFITRNVDKTTSHYSSNIKKINKAISTFENNNQKYTNVDLAIQTGMTIETVNQSMAIRNYRDEVHLDGCPSGVIDDKTVRKAQTPEEAYLEKEQNEIIYRSINQVLTPNEIAVLEMHFGINNHVTYAEGEIAKKLHIPKDKVKKLLNSAIRKLKESELNTIYSDHLKNQKSFIQDTCISFVPKDVADLELEQLEAVEIDF